MTIFLVAWLVCFLFMTTVGIVTYRKNSTTIPQIDAVFLMVWLIVGLIPVLNFILSCWTIISWITGKKYMLGPKPNDPLK